jgi:hypothetical protein
MLSTKPTSGNFSHRVLETLGIGEISQAHHHSTSVIDDVEWAIFQTQEDWCLLQDNKFAIIIKESEQQRIILISIIPDSGASLNDTPRIATLENRLINGEILPTELGFQQEPLPTVFVVNYDGIAGMVGQDTIKYGTSSSRQLLKNKNFQRLILYTNTRSIFSPLIDVTARILGSRFQTAKNEDEAIELTKQLL